ncbi:hypothetical protein HDU79_002225 [Rhizoclosmatium sp. JEL0117]|nr:hypothetical protein HDU79_002225 [Rhizoclosmatium sp. JEL0117]
MAATTTGTATEDQITLIKHLQTKNLKRLLPLGECNKEGFVTMEFDITLLQRMHQSTPAIVSLNTPTVLAGYALAVSKEVALDHPMLSQFVNTVDSTCVYNGTPVSTLNYITMAQLCVAKEFRGMGVVADMYARFKEEYRRRGFTCAVTSVAHNNPRSLKAHLKAGWVVLSTLEYQQGEPFDIVLLDFE